MNRDIIVDYLNNEMITAKNYKKFILSSGLLAIWGIVPGIFLGSYWLYIGIAMLLFFVACTFSVFGFLNKELTLEIKLKIQALIFTCWYFQFGGLSAIVFTYEYGINYELMFLYLPSLLFCLFLFVLTDIMLKTRKFSPKRNNSIKGFGFGFTSYLIGWRLISILDNSLTDNVAVPIVLSSLMFISTLISFGFLNFQKLYYLHKIDSISFKC